jgi:hypothetical protein
MAEGSPDNAAIWIQTIWLKPKDLTSTESRSGSCARIFVLNKKGREEQEKNMPYNVELYELNCLAIIVIRLRPRPQRN